MTPSEGLTLECQRAVQAVRSGQVQLGLGVARRAYHEAREGGRRSDLAHALNTMALCLSANGAYIEALASGIDAFRLYAIDGASSGRIRALCTIAGAATFILDSGEATLPVIERCVAEAAQRGDASLQVMALNTRAVALLKLKRFDAARAAFCEALELVPDSDGSIPPAVILCNMAGVAMRKAEAAPPERREALRWAAERELAEAMDASLSEGSLEGQSRALYIRAELAVQRGETHAALQALAESLGIAKALRHRYRSNVLLLRMADLHESLGDLAKALACLDAAHVEALSRRPCKELHVVCERLAALHGRLGHASESEHFGVAAGRERMQHERECDVQRRGLEAFLAEIDAGIPG